MKYFEHLISNQKDIQNQIEQLLLKHKVQPVGYGYIDCIVMKNDLDSFVSDLSTIGILISDVTWWCYVKPNHNQGCPHGMGGPISDYYDGMFSELQNESYELTKEVVASIMERYDRALITRINECTTTKIGELLKVPFRYTPTEYIEENKCVMPALWLLVPDDWRRIE